MERKHVVFLTVLSVATLLVAVVGATFAYFSTTVNKSSFTGADTDANKASVTTAKLAATTITFRGKADVAGNQINMTNAIPGDHDEAVFEIVNSGDIDINYDISWTTVNNTFVGTVADVVGEGKPEELVYTLTCTGGTTYTGSETQCPTASAGGKMNTTALTVTAGQTAVCTVRVDFKETGSAQNYNQGRSFSALVDVTTGEIKNN